MATIEQYDSLLQSQRILHMQVNLLNFDMQLLEQIQGVVLSCSTSTDNDSDIRRTANVSLVVTDSSWNLQTGGKIWLDKYVQILVGVENDRSENQDKITWFNRGVYLPNEPSITYSGSENTLSFSCVDLMAKMTGLRNGQLPNLEIQFHEGDNISNLMRAVVNDAGFMATNISQCNVTLPYDVLIEANGTVYDVLTQLKEFVPTWEFYFDINGIFCFDPIPTGQNETVVAYDELFDQVLLDYNISTSFERVKNYIEVLGRVHEPTYILASLTSTTSNIYAKTGVGWNGTSVATFSFSVTNIVTNPRLQIDSIAPKLIVDEYGDYVQLEETGVTYVVSYNPTMDKFIFVGHLQPQAVVKDDNINSPFFIGAEYMFTISSATRDNINVNNVLGAGSLNDYKDVLLGFDVNIETYGATLNIAGLSNVPIVDSKGKPVLLNGFCIVKYDGTNFVFLTHKIGIGIIRSQLNGGEYDDITSDSLALQRAKYELYLATNMQNTATLNLIPIYWLDVNQLVSWTPQGEEEPRLWLTKSISEDLSVDGSQSVTLMQYYPDYSTWDTAPKRNTHDWIYSNEIYANEILT